MPPAQRDELLQAVLEAPDEDGPRLVFADWLIENGDPGRGELITIQCQLAERLGLGFTGYDHYWLKFLDEYMRDLVKKELELLKAHESKWTAELKGIVYKGWFRRGFVERASIKMSELANRLEQAQKLAPIRHVRLLLFRDELNHELLRSLAMSQALESVDAVELVDVLGNVQLPSLLDAPSRMHGLRHLALDGGNLDDQEVDMLADQPWEKLESLSLARCSVKGSTLHRLFARVRTLNAICLNANPLSDQGAEALAKASQLTRIHELLIYHGSLSDAGVLALAQAPHLSSLRVVYLTDSQISAASALSIAQGTWSGLRALSMDGTRIGDEGAAALAQSDVLSLRYLSLANCGITDEAARQLVGSRALSGLQFLNLKGNTLSKETKTALRNHYGRGVCTFPSD